MKRLVVALFSLVMVSSATLTHAASSNLQYNGVRVYCNAIDAGAKIYVNDEYKGECPLDLFLPQGTFTIRAVKTPDADHEQVFSRTIKLTTGVATRVDVVLSPPQLTAAGIKKREIAAAKEDLEAAQQGDVRAMDSMADRYENGLGVERDSAQAAVWRQKSAEAKQQLEDARLAAEKKAEAERLAAEKKQFEADKSAAESGNIEAMEAMVKHYEDGSGVIKDSAQAAVWRQKIADARQAEKNNQELAQLKEEKKQFSFFPNTKEELTKSFKSTKDPLEGLTAGAFSPVTTVVTGLTDFLSLPTRISEWQDLSRKIDAHASAWAKPDSMMARYYLSQQAHASRDSDKLIADR